MSATDIAARARRALLLALLGGTALLPAATAATTDRVQVGRPGQNATPGFPLGLYLTVTTLPDVKAVGRYDGDSRKWQGPPFRATSHAGTAEIGWNVTFATVGSAAAMAALALAGDWPVVERPTVRIPHVVGARKVGSIDTTALLTKAPGDGNAQYESVAVFRLCGRVFAAAQFEALTPGFEYWQTPSDPIFVGGNVPAAQWNHDRALAGLRQVALVGYLPVGRLTARAAGRTITGTVRDCQGHPMAGLELRLLTGNATVARTRAAANGTFRLVARAPGTYRVATSPLTVTGKGGSGTRQDQRTVSVRVR